jgi:hypothetical protein
LVEERGSWVEGEVVLASRSWMGVVRWVDRERGGMEESGRKYLSLSPGALHDLLVGDDVACAAAAPGWHCCGLGGIGFREQE